jgi:hypothetical protein
MGSPDIFIVCVSAFIAVFVLLTVLALVMRALIAVFPQLTGGSDVAVLAAVSAAAAAAYPGARISKIEEQR